MRISKRGMICFHPVKCEAIVLREQATTQSQQGLNLNVQEDPVRRKKEIKIASSALSASTKIHYKCYGSSRLKALRIVTSYLVFTRSGGFREDGVRGIWLPQKLVSPHLGDGSGPLDRHYHRQSWFGLVVG